jgi:putative component of membrane protein insertase Oxa1/YidC/SpoIIIJ protein YidD
MCIKEFGLLKGVALTADRLTRCTSTAARDITEININPKTDKIIDQLEWYK